MADKYYDYSKLNSVSPYQPGKSKITKFSRNTLSEKADESSAQRKNDLAQVKDRAAKAQEVSAVKQGVAKGAADILAGGGTDVQSLLSGMVGSKISKKA